MSTVSGGFFDEVKSFVGNHKVLCVAILGLAVIGYSIRNLAGRAVSWIIECMGTTKKTDAVSREILSSDQDRAERLASSSSSNGPSAGSRIQQLRAEYNALKTKSLSKLTESTYVIPERRVCGIGGESWHTIQRAKKAVFVTNEEIIKIHPIKFLPNSPFILDEYEDIYEDIEDETMWSSILDTTKKQANAIAVTADGKHVILQQAVKSCVPTCMAMLILDRGKEPNYDAIRFTNLANTENAIGWAKEVELTCKVTEIPKENIIEVLSKCLAEKGPGMLTIIHSKIGGHVVILDEISIEKNEAIIRDPFHGWMVTVNLGALKKWLPPGEDFVQIV